MTRHIVLGTAAALLIAAPASALTMTPITDGRTIDAGGQAGAATDFDSDSPGPGFPGFTSEVSAFAIEFGDFGAGAGAIARQSSLLGPLSISGSGSTNASGSHGEVPLTAALGDAETPPALGFGEFLAGANSVLEILFHIDEAAAFDLEGFLSAGTELAFGNGNNGVINSASMILINTDTNVSVFEAEISDDSLVVDESGVIGPGNYKFSVEAQAEVFGIGLNEMVFLGDEDVQNGFVYETSAMFEGVSLELRATDKPIPEPVTTTLAGLGLGALALQTTRRRRA